MKKEKPLIVLDVDFVLLDWISGLKPFLKEKGMKFKHIDKFTGSTNYPKLSELFLDVNNETENILLMKEYNNSKWIEFLPAMREDCIKELKSMSSKYDFIALTCLGLKKNQKEKRTNNLKNIYGDIFKEVKCLEVRSSKKHYLKELKLNYNVLGLVDDREIHLNEAIEAGVKPFLYCQNNNNIMIGGNYNLVTSMKDVENILNRENKIEKKRKRLFF